MYNVAYIHLLLGLRPVEFHGNFFMSNTTDIELAGIDPFKVTSNFC